MTDQIRPYGPGKFSTQVDAYLYSLAQEGLNDEFTSKDQHWFGLLKADATTPLYDSEFECSVELNNAEQRFLASKAGAGLDENPDGNVTVEYFDKEEDLTTYWEGIMAERAEVGDEEAVDKEFAEIPEGTSSIAPTDEEIAQAEADGRSDAADGARPGDTPSLVRYAQWDERGFKSSDLTALTALTEAWRRGVYGYHQPNA